MKSRIPTSVPDLIRRSRNFLDLQQGCGSALIKCGSGYRSGSSIFYNCGSGSRIRIPDPDPGFDDLKLTKNLQLEIQFLFSWSKIAIYLSLGLHKGRPSYMRSLQPSKENTQHFKTWKFWTFSIFWVTFALLDPDPQFECGSRSSKSN